MFASLLFISFLQLQLACHCPFYGAVGGVAPISLCFLSASIPEKASGGGGESGRMNLSRSVMFQAHPLIGTAAASLAALLQLSFVIHRSNHSHGLIPSMACLSGRPVIAADAIYCCGGI